MFKKGLIEESAKELLDLNAEILKNVSEGIYLIKVSDGKIVYTNPKFEQMFGYEPGEMLGQNVAIVNAPSEISPEKKAKEIMAIIEKTGEWHGEIKNIKKDGTIFWCYSNVSIFNHHKFGKVLVSLHADITERKNLEEQSFKDKQEQKMLLDSIPAWIFYKDNNNKFVRVNKVFADVMKMSVEQLEGKSLYEIFPKEQAEAFFKDDTEVIGSGLPKIHIIESVAIKEGLLWVQTDKVPHRDEKGNIIGIIGFSIDITPRKLAEEESVLHNRELEKLNKLMVGRELEMIRLKKEISELKKLIG